MRPTSLWHWLLVAGGAVIAAISIGTVRLRRAVDRRVDALHAAASPSATETVLRESTTDLPPPVRRYFDAVLDDAVSTAHSIRLEQRGEFRLGDRSSPWKPMTATQHYTVAPPGFIWTADIELAPLLPVRVVDAYEQGRGSLRALVLSVVPVADAGPSPEMNEGELQRYLAEAVWFPTALRPQAGVEWELIDDSSARATIEDHGTVASLVFHFDDEGLVERVTAPERYRQADDSTAPWTGHFDNYRWHDGVRIPTEASVEWNLRDGALPYWRACLTSIDYRRS